MPSRIVYSTDFLFYYDDRTGDDMMVKNAMIVQYDTLEELQAANDAMRAKDKVVARPAQPERQRQPSVLTEVMNRVLGAFGHRTA